MRGKLYRWTEKEDIAVVEIVDTLINSNSDVMKRDLFNIAVELFNEQFQGKRTAVAFKNHYYWLKRQNVAMGVGYKEYITTDHALTEEASEIVSYMEGIVTSYESLRVENRQLKEENESLAAQLERANKQLANNQSDYDALLRVIEKARTICVNEEVGITKPKIFKMESNGNLVSA